MATEFSDKKKIRVLKEMFDQMDVGYDDDINLADAIAKFDRQLDKGKAPKKVDDEQKEVLDAMNYDVGGKKPAGGGSDKEKEKPKDEDKPSRKDEDERPRRRDDEDEKPRKKDEDDERPRKRDEDSKKDEDKPRRKDDDEDRPRKRDEDKDEKKPSRKDDDEDKPRKKEEGKDPKKDDKDDDKQSGKTRDWFNDYFKDCKEVVKSKLEKAFLKEFGEDRDKAFNAAIWRAKNEPKFLGGRILLQDALFTIVKSDDAPQPKKKDEDEKKPAAKDKDDDRPRKREDDEDKPRRSSRDDDDAPRRRNRDD